MSNIIDTIYNLTYKHPTLPKLNFNRVTLSGKTYISPLEFLKISVRRNLIARTLDFKLTGIYMDDYIPKHLNKKTFVDACANRKSHTNINFCRNTFRFDGNEVFNFTFDAAGECSYESVLEDMFYGDDEEMNALIEVMGGLTITINYSDMNFAHNFIGKGYVVIEVIGYDLVLESDFESEEITQDRFIKYGFGDAEDYQKLLECKSNTQE